MNIEELKLILDTVRSVTGEAGNVAVWWVVSQFVFPPILGFLGTVAAWGAFSYTVITIVVKITGAITNSHDWSRAGRSVSVMYGGRGWENFVDEDAIAIGKAISKAKETHAHENTHR